MSSLKFYSPLPSPTNVAIIATRWHHNVVDRLIDGAHRALIEADISPEYHHVMHVAGALELPLALSMALDSRRYNAYVMLGCVLKGKTDHYDHVARMANDAIINLATTHRLALGNGILTVHHLEHALARAEGSEGNLGYDAMKAALDLLRLSVSLSSSSEVAR